jgi:hypothetical protein
VTSEVGGIPLIGCAWNDNKRKLIVGTCGTTLEGSPHSKKRWRVNNTGEIETYYKQVKRPKIVELYFSGAPAVDIHNHYRQGGLALEQSIQTRTWWVRVFCTILGIIETDTYVAYIRFHQGAQELTHCEFTEHLALSLRENTFGRASARELRVRVQPTLDVLQCSIDRGPTHVLKPLIKHERFEDRRGTSTRAKLACEICKRRASTYCLSCYELTRALIPICGSGTSRDCFVQHARNRAVSD